MAAEPWSCFAPYQADIAAALEAARRQVFAAGRFRMRDVDSPPSTIEEACLQMDAEGTCSVLDMTDVFVTPRGVEGRKYREDDIGTVAPLAPGRIAELYGTETPTRRMVLSGHEIYECLDRGIGAYVVVYDGEAPAEIYFAGYSFD